MLWLKVQTSSKIAAFCRVDDAVIVFRKDSITTSYLKLNLHGIKSVLFVVV